MQIQGLEKVYPPVGWSGGDPYHTDEFSIFKTGHHCYLYFIEVRNHLSRFDCRFDSLVRNAWPVKPQMTPVRPGLRTQLNSG